MAKNMFKSVLAWIFILNLPDDVQIENEQQLTDKLRRRSVATQVNHVRSCCAKIYLVTQILIFLFVGISCTDGIL